MLKFPPIKGKSLIDYIVGQKYAKKDVNTFLYLCNWILKFLCLW